MLEYSVHYDPNEMDDLNDLSPFNLKKDLKNISEDERLLIAEEIANELIKGIHRPPNTVVRYWAKLRNAAWVKIKTMGTVIAQQRIIPAVTVELINSGWFSALCLVIIRETVMGMPEDEMVSSRPKTVSAI